jgi:transcriptional regulator with XRE-family HTH domain
MLKPSEIFTANVRQLRAARGLTQATLANMITEAGCSMSRAGLAVLETGHRVDPGIDLLVAVAEAFGVPPTTLLAPFQCEACKGEPPAGFRCTTCGCVAS